MIKEYKPKINKGLKIEYQNKIYDKIIYLNISDNEVRFENNENESTTNNVCCKLSEIELKINE